MHFKSTNDYETIHRSTSQILRQKSTNENKDTISDSSSSFKTGTAQKPINRYRRGEIMPPGTTSSSFPANTRGLASTDSMPNIKNSSHNPRRKMPPIPISSKARSHSNLPKVKAQNTDSNINMRKSKSIHLEGISRERKNTYTVHRNHNSELNNQYDDFYDQNDEGDWSEDDAKSNSTYKIR